MGAMVTIAVAACSNAVVLVVVDAFICYMDPLALRSLIGGAASQ